MDKIPDSIKPLVEKYISVLRTGGVRLDGAYLFGSYSRGTADEGSDIDIALI
jgi:predicted nucleotidyltransferase